jgi:hypothetical protein
MVPIDHQVDAAVELVDSNKYFCINRGRQYGKTTTLAFLKEKLEEKGYVVFSVSFEGLPDSTFETLEALLSVSVSLMARLLKWTKISNLVEQSSKELVEIAEKRLKEISVLDFQDLVATLCSRNRVVLLIDEVDQAGNYPSFIKFLGLLRSMYLSRAQIPAFQSVVLAGVYDIKNLKLKMRPDEEHQYNSPWNIAAPFETDMSLHPDGIAQMLAEYKNDHHLDFDENDIAQMVYDYTSGYPFLVSRLCQIIDENRCSWDKDGLLKAINQLLKESNTLFDDLTKKIDQFPNLSMMLQSIIYEGKRIAYNYYDKDINLASMFNIVYNNDGATAIKCRIFETWLYNFYSSKEKMSAIFQRGEAYKTQFIKDGHLDMRLIKAE